MHFLGKILILGDRFGRFLSIIWRGVCRWVSFQVDKLVGMPNFYNMHLRALAALKKNLLRLFPNMENNG